ncbi:MAG: HDOD domain-containing protein [Burkholderiales bacterium]|nr:HDOD domain-containing protein [Burkholderiales bacterium]
MRTAQAIVGDAVKLVSLPDIYRRAKRIIDDPRCSAGDLAEVISKDAAMSARLLRLVNSAFWGFGGQIGSVSRAVMLLGTLHVHDVILATSVAQVFSGIAPRQMDLARFWRASVYRALAAASFARKAELPDAERLFVEGLLSDLGHMILYQKLPELAARALQLAGGDPDALPALERELIGCDYAQVGAALVRFWGLPECFRAVIEFQDEPAAAGEHAREAALLHVAARLAARHAQDCAAAHTSGEGSEPSAISVNIAVPVWEIVGLDELCIPEVSEEVGENLVAVVELFGLGSSAAPPRAALPA